MEKGGAEGEEAAVEAAANSAEAPLPPGVDRLPSPEPEQVLSSPRRPSPVPESTRTARASNSTDKVARTIAIAGLVATCVTSIWQYRNSSASAEGNRRAAQDVVARLIAASDPKQSAWLVITAFAKEHEEQFQFVSRTRSREDATEKTTRSDAAKLGTELQSRISADAKGAREECGKLMYELARLGEELAKNREHIEPMKSELQRVMGRLVSSEVLSACLVVTSPNETRVGHFVATYFHGAEPCDAPAWFQVPREAPGLQQVLTFTELGLKKCSEREVPVPIRSMKLEGCDGIVNQIALFAENSTMVRGSFTASYVPPGPVSGNSSRLSCMKWESENKQGLIEVGAILDGGAFVRMVVPGVRELMVEVSGAETKRAPAEPLRFDVRWSFEGSPRDQGLDVTVNGVRRTVPRLEEPAP